MASHSRLNRIERIHNDPQYRKAIVRSNMVHIKRRNDRTRLSAIRSRLLWTEDEVAALYTKATACELAARLGRSQHAILRKRQAIMNLEKRQALSPQTQRTTFLVSTLSL